MSRDSDDIASLRNAMYRTIAAAYSEPGAFAFIVPKSDPIPKHIPIPVAFTGRPADIARRNRRDSLGDIVHISRLACSDAPECPDSGLRGNVIYLNERKLSRRR